jgi:hypothetical protein
MHPRGTVAALLDLGTQGCCALAAHEGAVLARADKVYADPELARRALEDIRQAYPSVRMLSDVRNGLDDPDALEAWDGRESLSLDSLAQAAGEPILAGVRLRPVPRAWWRKPVLWAALVLGLAVSGPRLFAQYERSGMKTPAGVDAHAAWSHAQSAALENHRLHGEAGTRALLGVFYALPVNLAGWRLGRARCAAEVERWVCEAEYLRVRRGADNRGLLRTAPSDWRFDFPTTDRAAARWFSSMMSVPLDQALVPAPADQDRNWMSVLQAIQPAFSTVRVEPSRTLSVTEPLGSNRQPLPRPAELPRYGMRGVHVDGPLRAANLLVSLSAHMAWSKAELSIADHPAVGGARSPINLSLDGALYEMEVPTDPLA